MEAEMEASKPVDEAEEQKKAVLAAAVTEFENQYARPLSIFNSDLFPESEYDQRNGQSRKDGYWKYVGKGEEAPLDFTYGEFPLALFTKLVDRACALGGLAGADRSSLSMADLGSGTGRLALWAAATSQWKKVSGIEYLPTIAEDAQAKLSLAKLQTGLLQTEDVQLIEGSWDDPTALEWSELDLCFAYTTAITASEDGILEGLSAALTKRLRRGAIVVTTDYKLDPAGFEVLESHDGVNDGAGGVSTGFIHLKICAGEYEEEGVVAAAAIEEAVATAVADAEDGAAAFAAMEAALLGDLEDAFEAMEAQLLGDLKSAFGE